MKYLYFYECAEKKDWTLDTFLQQARHNANNKDAPLIEAFVPNREFKDRAVNFGLSTWLYAQQWNNVAFEQFIDDLEAKMNETKELQHWCRTGGGTHHFPACAFRIGADNVFKIRVDEGDEYGGRYYGDICFPIRNDTELQELIGHLRTLHHQIQEIYAELAKEDDVSGNDYQACLERLNHYDDIVTPDPHLAHLVNRSVASANSGVFQLLCANSADLIVLGTKI